MYLILIKNMKYDSMLKLTKHLYDQNYYLDSSDKELIISFERLEFIEPAGAILLLSTIDKFLRDGIPHYFEPINRYRHKDAVSYGETMGIFQQLGISDAPAYTSGARYLAPTRVDIQEIYEESRVGSMTIEDYFEEIAQKLVSKTLNLARTDLENSVEDLFVFVVREMIRNIFDHSNASHYYYALQAYEKTNCVEVVIADFGVGLLETVPFNVEERWYGLDTDEEAIRKSLLPGVSALSNHSYAPEYYKNSGYGLALVKRIIQETKGLFSIASGLKSITYSCEEEIVDDCDITGTMVRMNINLTNLKSVHFDSILKEAEREAKDKGSNMSPSSASKTLRSKEIKR